MSDQTPYRPYAEVLKEFRQRVDILKTQYKLEQRTIASHIGEHATNFSRYLDKQKDKPCSLNKLQRMLANLNKHYHRELQLNDAVAESAQPYGNRQPPFGEIGIPLQALTEMILEFIARSEQRPVPQLFEEFIRKKAEIAKRSPAP